MPRPALPPSPAPPGPVDGPEGLRTQLAAIRATLAILADHGAAVPPAKVAAYLDVIERAAEPYLRGLSEPNAQLFTGRSADWLRARYKGWAARGLAWTQAGRRYYAECALPHRAPRLATEREARQAAYDASRAGSPAARPAPPSPRRHP